MSINPSNIYMAQQVINLFPSPNKLKMLELGNMKILDVEKVPVIAKQYFTEMGIEHTSFDINELDGAIKINLCLPIEERYKNQFDIITDFGTIEHIEKQEQVFRNVHECCKIGGYMIHSLPLENTWVGHCPYHYKFEFPDNLAKTNGYELILKEIKILPFIL